MPSLSKHTRSALGLALLVAPGAALAQQALATPSVDQIVVHKGARTMDLYAQGRLIRTIAGIQLGGDPDMNPEGLLSRSASQYAQGGNLVDMIKENLIAERIAIDTYREIIRYLGDKDVTTRRMFEEILAVEEEHADDMADLLEGRE